MAKTTFSGPVYTGTIKTGSLQNLGKNVVSQSVAFTVAANIANVTDADGQTVAMYNNTPATATAAFGTAATASFNIPANSQILDIVIDVPVALVGPTAANLTVGSTSTGTQYVASTDLMTGPVVRVRPTFTNAQLLAMLNTTTATVVYAQLTATVASITAGAVVVTVTYVQN